MKKYLIPCLLLIVNFKAFTQAIFNDPLCSDIKYDTLSKDFIVEVSASFKYYSKFDAIVQNDNIYPYDTNKKFTFTKMYNSDTIIIKFWSEGKDFYRDRNKCLDLNSISTFDSKIAYGTLSKKEKRELNKSIINDKNGAKFLKIHARIVVINAGANKWLIPKIYSVEKCESAFDCCERTFANTLILARILEWDLLR